MSYRLFRQTIQPQSAFLTPLQSDTLFGHLMWALRYLDGEEKLKEFLERYRSGPPPLLISRGMPQGYLPMPVVPSLPREERLALIEKLWGSSSTANQRAAVELFREVIQRAWLPLELWQQLVNGLSPSALFKLLLEEERLDPHGKSLAITRTAVDRITSSGREGQLFVKDETFYPEDQPFDIWFKLSEEAIADGLLDRLNEWWMRIEATGFGHRKSSGAGAFGRVGDVEPADGQLPTAGQPNAFATLSAYVPKPGDPVEGHYRTRIKRGKLGEGYALPKPWKKPLIMLAPGSIFRTHGADVADYYGQLVEGIHWTIEGIVQYAYAFPLPVRLG
jgi:CRISPR-associated protein Csm4